MKVFDVKIDNLTMDEALDKIRDFLRDGKQHYIVLPYSEFVIRAQKDEELKKILNKADLSLCEAKGLLIMTRLAGKKIKQNIYGTDLIYEIAKLPNKIFLLGGTKDVVKKTADRLGNNISYEYGYGDLNKAIDKINKAKPEILLVALGGSAMQEKWIYNNIKKMPSVKIAIGVGGAFDFISGKIKRAPKFIQKSGTEWLWRLIIQPNRFKRITTGVFGLMKLALKEKLK